MKNPETQCLCGFPGKRKERETGFEIGNAKKTKKGSGNLPPPVRFPTTSPTNSATGFYIVSLIWKAIMKPEYRLNAEPSIDIIRITEKHMLPVRKQRQFPRNKQYQTTSLYSYLSSISLPKKKAPSIWTELSKKEICFAVFIDCLPLLLRVC